MIIVEHEGGAFGILICPLWPVSNFIFLEVSRIERTMDSIVKTQHPWIDTYSEAQDQY